MFKISPLPRGEFLPNNSFEWTGDTAMESVLQVWLSASINDSNAAGLTSDLPCTCENSLSFAEKKADIITRV